MQKLHKTTNPLKTPQTEQIPGRSDQVQNDAGGFGWTPTLLQRLARFLILGSEGGTYYATEKELTLKSFDVLNECLNTDPKAAVNLIAEVSEAGRAAKNDPALFALAVAASHEDPKVRSLALEALPRVARIGTHLFHFVEYLTARDSRRRGWGRALRTAVGRFYTERDALGCAHQLEKYRSREGWSHKDLLRLAHPTPPTFEHSWLFARTLGTKMREDKRWGEAEHALDPKVGTWVGAVSAIATTTDPKVAAKLIVDHRLPREVVPTELLNSPEVWSALLVEMPITALVRNLANLTRSGVVGPMSEGTKRVLELLGDEAKIKRSMIHPMQILLALWTYRTGRSGFAGRGVGREEKTWSPVGRVIDALDGAFYMAFANVRPTGKRFLLAIDGSGSMMQGYGSNTQPFVAAQVAAAMAMVTARTETLWHPILYDTHVYEFPDLTPHARLDQLLKAMPQNGCGTNGALPFEYAQQQKLNVDVFLSYTDGQTWAGNQHPAQALKNYRRSSGIGDARAINVQAVLNATSQADPKDSGMLDVVGFDTTVPAVISAFARGEL